MSIWNHIGKIGTILAPVLIMTGGFLFIEKLNGGHLLVVAGIWLLASISLYVEGYIVSMRKYADELQSILNNKSMLSMPWKPPKPPDNKYGPN